MREEEIKKYYPISFKGENIRIALGTYPSSNINAVSIFSWNEELGMEELYAIPSVNAELTDLADDEVAIKTWGENKDLYKLLLKEGIIEKNHAKAQIGYGIVYICQLKDQEK